MTEKRLHPKPKADAISEIVSNAISADLDKIIEKKNVNFNKYTLFKSIKDETEVKLFPLAVEDNKNISEIVESVSDLDIINQIKPDVTDDELKAVLSEYRRKVVEMEENINEIVSDKVVLTKTNKNIDVSKINLLDYQYIILNIFTIMNNNIKFKFDEKKEEQLKLLENKVISGQVDKKNYLEEYMQIKNKDIDPAEIGIPLNVDILSKVKETMSSKNTIEFEHNKVKFSAQLNYLIRKLVYDKSKKELITSEPVKKEDFETWMDKLEYKISDNITLLFRPINIADYLDIYITITEIQTKYKLNKVRKISNELIDMNLRLFNNLILGIVHNEQFINIKDSEEIKEKIKIIFNKMSDTELIEITKMIYSSVFRFEIDINIYKENTLLKSDTWYDTGLSFFFL